MSVFVNIKLVYSLGKGKINDTVLLKKYHSEKILKPTLSKENYVKIHMENK